MMCFRRAALVAMGSLLVSPAAVAQSLPERPLTENDETELAREVENPISKLGSIPFQNEVDFGIGPYNRVRNTLSVQPTYGFALTRDVGIVSRTRVPIVSRPDLMQPSGTTFGVGDVTEALFVVPTPSTSSGALWGAGPAILLPTATETALGTGKVGLGPVAAVRMQARPWTYGVVAGQIWSVLGPATRPDVSQLSVMPFATFEFPRGWYFKTAPIITANWDAGSARNMWTVPVGGGGGKVFFVGTLPLDLSVGVYWNAIRTGTAASASVSAQVQIAFLFPRGAR
jgi:hypothetical protein